MRGHDPHYTHYNNGVRYLFYFNANFIVPNLVILRGRARSVIRFLFLSNSYDRYNNILSRLY